MNKTIAQSCSLTRALHSGSNKVNLLALLLFSVPLHAQVVTDGTVGAAITLDGQNITITQDLGTLQGNNLFHSFQTFNIQTNGSVNFTGANNIDNVISRVTGGEISNIDGTLSSDVEQASFFFINPAGIVFGAGASVYVPAAFHVSTADELRFADGAVFSASNPEISSLTLASPEAFGFLGQNQSEIFLDKAQLNFNQNSVVSVVSGDIAILGGRINASGDDLSIVAQGSNSSSVPISGNAVSSATGNLTITDSYISAYLDDGIFLLHAGDIMLNDGAFLSTFGSDIYIKASNISIKDGASIETDTLDENRVNILMVAHEITIDRQGSDQFTGVLNRNYTNAVGSVIKVSTDDLIIVNGGQIKGTTFTEGDAASLMIKADRIVVDRRFSYPTGISSVTALESSGNGGAIEVKANELTIINGGEINTSSFGDGDAGSVNVNSDRIFINYVGDVDAELENSGEITSVSFGAGAGGQIVVTTKDLTLFNGGSIDVTSYGEGNAGSIIVKADKLLITNQGSDFVAGIQSRGSQGSIAVDAGYVALLGGQITTTSSGEADGGPIDIKSDVLVMEGGFIQANADNGQGGKIDIQTKAVVPFSNALLIGGDERLEYQNDGPNVIQAVAPGGVNGLVDINAPEVDVSGSLLALDPSFVDITGLAFDPCAAFVSGAPSTFTVLGRGGLPESFKGETSLSLTEEFLNELLDGDNPSVDLRTFNRINSIDLSLPDYSKVALPNSAVHSRVIEC